MATSDLIDWARRAPTEAVTRARNLSPGWWGAIASGAAAGAVTVPAHRVLGALAFGAGLLTIALLSSSDEGSSSSCECSRPKPPPFVPEPPVSKAETLEGQLELLAAERVARDSTCK